MLKFAFSAFLFAAAALAQCPAGSKLTWNPVGGELGFGSFDCTAPPGGGPNGFTQSVVAQTALAITAAVHKQGVYPIAACFDNASPANAVQCSYTVDTSGNVAFSWNPAFTGSVVLISGGVAASYVANVTAQTSLTITAVTHGNGQYARGSCYDSTGGAGNNVQCSWSRNGSGDVTFTWNPAFTGSIQIVR